LIGASVGKKILEFWYHVDISKLRDQKIS
jgi:hypothetical protein